MTFFPISSTALAMIKNEESQDPPKMAENLLCLVLPRAEREEVIGSMIECFNRDIIKYDLKKARRYFWMETLREIFPFVNRFIQWLIRTGIVTCLGHIIHRFIS